MQAQSIEAWRRAFHANELTREQVGSLLDAVTQLSQRVAWFERQLFGQKSERRLLEPDAVQGSLGGSFDEIPAQRPAVPKIRVDAHERDRKLKQPALDGEDAQPFFDEAKVPVEVIEVPNPELEGLAPQDYEIVGEKATHRLAQRPGSYVVLKYVRQVIKRRDTQQLVCAPAPLGVIEGSRADVSFIAGMIVDKFAYHLPLYRQHQRLQAAGMRVSRQWLTQLMQTSVSLLEPIHDAQLLGVLTDRVKAMDESVSRTGSDSGCCTGDGSRPPEVGLQEQASNRSVLLRSKDGVVSDREEIVRQGRKVCFEKMSASKPSDDASLIVKVLSKLRSSRHLRTNWGVTCLRTQWQPVLRRHELETGSGTERENLVLDAKGNDKW